MILRHENHAVSDVRSLDGREHAVRCAVGINFETIAQRWNKTAAEADAQCAAKPTLIAIVIELAVLRDGAGAIEFHGENASGIVGKTISDGELPGRSARMNDAGIH